MSLNALLAITIDRHSPSSGSDSTSIAAQINLNITGYLCCALTCASVATVRPNVNAICGTDASPSAVLPTPMKTKKNVPSSSPSSIRQMFLFSVMSAMPTSFDMAANNRNNLGISMRLDAIINGLIKPRLCARHSLINYEINHAATSAIDRIGSDRIERPIAATLAHSSRPSCEIFVVFSRGTFLMRIFFRLKLRFVFR